MPFFLLSKCTHTVLTAQITHFLAFVLLFFLHILYAHHRKVNNQVTHPQTKIHWSTEGRWNSPLNQHNKKKGKKCKQGLPKTGASISRKLTNRFWNMGNPVGAIPESWESFSSTRSASLYFWRTGVHDLYDAMHPLVVHITLTYGHCNEHTGPGVHQLLFFKQWHMVIQFPIFPVTKQILTNKKPDLQNTVHYCYNSHYTHAMASRTVCLDEDVICICNERQPKVKYLSNVPK